MPTKIVPPGNAKQAHRRKPYPSIVLCIFVGWCGIVQSRAPEQPADNSKASTSIGDIRLAPGDDKTGYADANYQTDSLSLENRNGQAADLLAIANEQHLGLPPLPIAIGNQPDVLKIALGRKLFFDRRLSGNKTMSCAMCHIPEQGFTNNELVRPIGFEGRSIKRNAPTILNVAYYPRLFADARESSLEQQVWSPLLASNEMNNPSIGVVVDTIARDPAYARMFAAAFGKGPDMLNIGQAIAQYERTLLAANSPFDQWYFGGKESALNATEIAGFKLFIGQAGCVSCHLLSRDNALFTDHQLHNTGVGYRASMHPTNNKITVQLAPGMTADVDREVITSVGEPKPNDLGRYEVTLNPDDRWKFRTPSLRNIALTAPYMHDGEFVSLREVVAFYNMGGERNSLLSPLIRPLGLTDQQQIAIVEFLKSLTGSQVKRLVADAFAVPIGDTASENQ
ncbi:MAG: hypothetical protein HKN85_07210 [Gammaproteobacteria bacterium]|nr:hypothetical protein [Gammaproteobacteria bacterium]